MSTLGTKERTNHVLMRVPILGLFYGRKVLEYIEYIQKRTLGVNGSGHILFENFRKIPPDIDGFDFRTLSKPCIPVGSMRTTLALHLFTPDRHLHIGERIQVSTCGE